MDCTSRVSRCQSESHPGDGKSRISRRTRRCTECGSAAWVSWTFGGPARGREQLHGFPVEYCMKRSEKVWRMVGLALAIGVPLAWAVSAATGTIVADATTAAPAFALPRSFVAGPVTPPRLSPGIYTTTPYSMLVFVPAPIDQRMVYRPDISHFKMPCKVPPMHLERR